MDTKTLQLANVVVKESLNNGRMVTPIKDTALYHLVELAKPKKEDLALESLNTSLGLVLDRLETPVPLLNTTSRAELLNELDSVYINPLRNQLAFVRNTVNPVIREVVENVKLTLEQRAKRDDVIVIKPLYIPDELYGTVGNRIRHHVVDNNPNNVGPAFKPNFTDLTSDTIRDFISEVNESAGLDELATNLILEIEKEITATYNIDIYQTLKDEFLMVSNSKLAGKNPSFKNMLLGTLAYFFINKLYQYPIANLGLATDQFNVWCAFARNACARLVIQQVDLFSSYIRNGLLISNVDTDKKTLYVINNTLDQLIEKSDDYKEVLIGVLNEDWMKYRSLSSVLDNQDKLQAKGKLILKAVQQGSLEAKASRRVDAIIGEIVRLVEKTNLEDDKDGINLRSFIPTGLQVGELRMRLRKELQSKFPGNRLAEESITHLVYTVVCDVFFNDTLAKVILSTLERVEIEDKKDSDHSTLISIAIINMVTEWVANQIQLHE